jgi:hypothetical protein
MAVDYKVNFMLETPTWRASRDWGAQVGFVSFHFFLSSDYEEVHKAIKIKIK